jgi:hypothetical protein
MINSKSSRFRRLPPFTSYGSRAFDLSTEADGSLVAGLSSPVSGCRLAQGGVLPANRVCAEVGNGYQIE